MIVKKGNLYFISFPKPSKMYLMSLCNMFSFLSISLLSLKPTLQIPLVALISKDLSTQIYALPSYSETYYSMSCSCLTLIPPSPGSSTNPPTLPLPPTKSPTTPPCLTTLQHLQHNTWTQHQNRHPTILAN